MTINYPVFLVMNTLEGDYHIFKDSTKAWNCFIEMYNDCASWTDPEDRQDFDIQEELHNFYETGCVFYPIEDMSDNGQLVIEEITIE